MVITWFGLSCFKIASGSLTAVTDPFAKTVGLTPPRIQTDILLISNIHAETSNNHSSREGDRTFVIDGPGEFDLKGLFVRGITAEGDAKYKTNDFDYTTIYAVRMEDIRLGFLGSLKQRGLTDTQLEDFGEIDILFIPVGGETVCAAEEAVTIVNQIEPRLVIPMHFAQKGLRLPADKIEQFLKEMGAGKITPQEKLTTKKSALLEENETTGVFVLTPQR